MSKNQTVTESAKKYYGAIDLGGTFIKGGIVDSEGNIIIKDKVPTGRERPFEQIVSDMAKLLSKCAESSNLKMSDLSAIGIGSPGNIDSATGTIKYSPNIAWKEVPLAKQLNSETGLPVFVGNDANVAALGESYKGAGNKMHDVVFLTLGTGVGGGIIIDGKLFEGNKSAGAEIGHIVIRSGGEKCACGRRGCFEAYCSASALIRETEKAMKAHPESLLHKYAVNGVPDGKTSFDAAQEGDKVAKRVLNKYITYLAEGVTNIINVLRPQAIVIGGGVSAQGENLLKPLRRKVHKRMYGGSKYAPVKILCATLGNDAGLVGAARLAQQRSEI